MKYVPLLLVLSVTTPARAEWLVHQAPNPKPTVAFKWLETLLEASARSVDRIGARPTILSREMAITVTAMYDAWAAYDAKAVGTQMGGKLRRPPAERTLANKEKAIGYAAYRCLVNLYPEDTKWIDEQARTAGVDPKDIGTDPKTPQGIGNVAAAAIIEARKHDGANQYGDEKGGNGKPYADYIGYKPQNPTDKILNPDRWQEIPFSDGKGGIVYIPYLTPFWGKVKPFALEKAEQFRPAPYPKVGSPELAKDVDEVVKLNGGLTLEQKAIVEFMRDGPRSTGQSGHWLRFAEDVSRRDNHDLDKDVKMFFAVANVVFDAFIACWEAKLFYDSSRPWTLIRHLKKGTKLRGYAGPWKGYGMVPAEQWHPYSPATFVTPPFPGYPSGHSTASAAGSTILALFTGSDRYEAVAKRTAGELTEGQCAPSQMQAMDGKPAANPGSPQIQLKMPTFTAVAEMAGISRVMGGYHIQSDNTAGLELGRKVAKYSWPKYQAYFDGTAHVTMR
jgi:hypothetical protein